MMSLVLTGIFQDRNNKRYKRESMWKNAWGSMFKEKGKQYQRNCTQLRSCKISAYLSGDDTPLGPMG